MTRFAVLALFALVTGLSTLPARAAVTTNYSDVWWNPLESGWGVNISQQADFLFVSFFVYGPNGQPFWYTAQLTLVGQLQNGSLLFSGDNYVTNGPRFDGPFDPSAVGIRKVGSATFTATSVIAGNLTYAVDGITVTKSLVRQTLKTENISGTYLGGATTTQSCTNPAFNGTFLQGTGVTISQNGSVFQMATIDVETGRQCAWTGTYIQDGQMARVGGTYSCSSGESGSFSFFEIQSSISGLMGRLATQSTFSGATCNITGRLAAVRAP